MFQITPRGKDRKAFSREFVGRIMQDLVSSAELREERLRACGRWDDLQQLRLDGLRAIAAEIEDCSLRALSDLAFNHGLRVELDLLKPEDGSGPLQHEPSQSEA